MEWQVQEVRSCDYSDIRRRQLEQKKHVCLIMSNVGSLLNNQEKKNYDCLQQQHIPAADLMI